MDDSECFREFIFLGYMHAWLTVGFACKDFDPKPIFCIFQIQDNKNRVGGQIK